MLQILEEKLKWRNYGDKHHESKYTAFFQAYILTRKFNIDKRKLHYSAKVRNGQLSREDALKIIQKDPYNGGIEDLDYCMKKLDLTYNDFYKIMNEPPKSFMDYYSYYTLVKTFKKPISWGNKVGIIPDTVYKKYFSFNV